MAGEFALRYDTLVDNPYATTFTYGRTKIEEVPAGARVVDAGCGTGFTLHKLCRPRL